MKERREIGIGRFPERKKRRRREVGEWKSMMIRKKEMN